MIPMRTSTIFKSRWMALIWSAGIIWMAIDIAGPPSDSDNQSAIADNGVDHAITALSDIK